MSRVYKQSQVELGEEKIVKLSTSQIIKANTNITNRTPVEESEEDYMELEKKQEEASGIIANAKLEANQLLEAAKLESSHILETAKVERDTIISDAYTEGNQILENARKEGYNQGLAEGKDIGLKEMDSLIEEAKDIKQNAIQDKKIEAYKLESQLINLVVASVRKIIDHEVERDNQLLLNLIQKGIEKCIYTDRLIIRASTKDYETVNSSKNKIFMMTEGIDSIEVKGDPALKDGHIIIETASGTVDASIETQIAQIEQIFNDILKGDI